MRLRSSKENRIREATGTSELSTALANREQSSDSAFARSFSAYPSVLLVPRSESLHRTSDRYHYWHGSRRTERHRSWCYSCSRWPCLELSPNSRANDNGF